MFQFYSSSKYFAWKIARSFMTFLLSLKQGMDNIIWKIYFFSQIFFIKDILLLLTCILLKRRIKVWERDIIKLRRKLVKNSKVIPSLNCLKSLGFKNFGKTSRTLSHKFSTCLHLWLQSFIECIRFNLC